MAINNVTCTPSLVHFGFRNRKKAIGGLAPDSSKVVGDGHTHGDDHHDDHGVPGSASGVAAGALCAVLSAVAVFV